MSRQKLVRFEMNKLSRNVIEADKPTYETIKGNWHKEQFNNNNDIVVELACGRGEYTVGLAEVFPDKNFIGVDIKGSRIWKGSGYAQENGLENVAFLRTHIQNLENFFEQGEVSEIWITFPDPRPKGRDEKRRLTSPRFLDMYRHLMRPDGLIHLKTDNVELFDYTLEILQTQKIQQLEYTRDLYNSVYADDHKGIKTRFEMKYLDLGQPIHYLRFRFA
jgi:tRNA (guanine-N7-)-methyltransferase